METFFSTLLQRSHAVKGYYQYQCFMGGIELLQDLIHYWVGQIRDDRQLHLPEKRRAKDRITIKSVILAQVLGSTCITSSLSYSRALLISSAALSMRALRMAERGMETCSEMDERGGLSLSAAEQDIGHNSRHRDTIESTTTWKYRHAPTHIH